MHLVGIEICMCSSSALKRAQDLVAVAPLVANMLLCFVMLILVQSVYNARLPLVQGSNENCPTIVSRGRPGGESGKGPRSVPREAPGSWFFDKRSGEKTLETKRPQERTHTPPCYAIAEGGLGYRLAEI